MAEELGEGRVTRPLFDYRVGDLVMRRDPWRIDVPGTGVILWVGCDRGGNQECLVALVRHCVTPETLMIRPEFDRRLELAAR